MYLVENVIMSNGGVNGERETFYLNEVLLCLDPTNEKWARVPADMLVVDGWLRVKLMTFIEKGSDFHLLREVKGVRHAWFVDNKKVITGRRLLAIFYNSLRRSSSRQMNLNNIQHLMELSYYKYLDKYMEEIIEELNRRVNLIENVDQLMVEAYLQKELMSPESDQTVLKLLEILENGLR